MAYLVTAIAILAILMLALRWLAMSTVGNFGVLGGVALLAVLFAIGFWWERKYPTRR